MLIFTLPDLNFFNFTREFFPRAGFILFETSCAGFNLFKTRPVEVSTCSRLSHAGFNLSEVPCTSFKMFKTTLCKFELIQDLPVHVLTFLKLCPAGFNLFETVPCKIQLKFYLLSLIIRAILPRLSFPSWKILQIYSNDSPIA